MSQNKIIRAWRDPKYRMSLNAEQKNAMPEHPAGVIDLNGADLDSVTGGLPCTNLTTYGTYTSKGWRCL
jgi:mersacidin/lichenicidin family type 2 lantibiotic